MTDAAATRPARRWTTWALATTGGRAFGMVLAAASVPVLLGALGDEAFGAWAVLQGAATFLFALEFGIGPSLVRYLAPALRSGDRGATDRLLASGFFPAAAIYAVGFAAVWFAAPAVAAWQGFPDQAWLSGAGMIRLACAGYLMQALLSLLLTPVHAAERFVLLAVVTTGTGAAAQIAAWVAAWTTHRLDCAIAAWWIATTACMAAGVVAGRVRAGPWSLSPSKVEGDTVRSLLRHGVFLQASQIAGLVHSQLGKVLLGPATGLASVPPLDAADKVHAGARAFPAAMMNVFLPDASARHAAGHDIHDVYVRMTRIAAVSCVFCVLLPVALGPVLFPAWTPSLAADALRLYAILAPGIFLNLWTAPISTIVQAMGRTSVQARMSLLSLVVNLVLLLVLLRPFGADGAAAATSVALSVSAFAYLGSYHAIAGRAVRDTLAATMRVIAGPLALLVVAGAAAEGARRVIGDGRLAAAGAAAAIGAAYAAGVLAILAKGRALDDAERASLRGLPVVGRWFR